jgi:L-2-hydroxyglutarate oxidase LhgO
MKVAMANAKTSFSKKEFLKQIQSLCEGIRESHLKPYRAGIRAQMVDLKGRLVDDMMVRHEKGSTHVLNAVSPGMTCSPAFAEFVVNQILHK